LKIGFISDIHSNKDALYAVLNDMEKKGVDKIICLGDMITKYAYPREVVDALRANCEVLIKGNCDQNVVENKSFKFARAKLGLDNIEYIDSLPIKKQLLYHKLLLNFFHATLTSKDKIYTPTNGVSENEMLYGNKPQVSFAGHTHIPYISMSSPNGMKIVTDSKVYLEEDKKYIVNVGSVGDPLQKNKNQNSKNNWLIAEYMSYVLFTMDSENPSVELIKVPYRNLLVKVYQNFVRKQQPNLHGERMYPRSPMDTLKIYESLIHQGAANIPKPEEIDKPLGR